jgi:hypothetical protein
MGTIKKFGKIIKLKWSILSFFVDVFSLANFVNTTALTFDAFRTMPSSIWGLIQAYTKCVIASIALVTAHHGRLKCRKLKKPV